MAYKLEKCILAVVAALGTYSLWASRADAQEIPQPVCGPTQNIDAFLRSKGYAEASFGVMANGQAAMMIYATPGGAAWAVILMGTDGQACFSYEGTDFFPGAVPPAPVEGERAA